MQSDDDKEAASPDRVCAEPPPEAPGVRVGPAKRSAAGMPAVFSSAKHLITEMGIARSARVMLKVNQKGGIDCSSCAWPEPDGDRSFAEFCESGAKAIADEATTKRVTAKFFRRYSVAELSRHSDMWLGKQGRLTEPMVLREGATHYEPIGWDAA